jgi:TolA-binding protein
MKRRHLVQLAIPILLIAGFNPVAPLCATGQPSLAAAKAAVEDGLYALALKQAEALIQIQESGDPGSRGAATVIAARAYHGQERYRELILFANDQRIRGCLPEHAAALLFWRAMAHADLGEYDQALADIAVLDSQYGHSPYAPQALRLRAWCLLKKGRKTDALILFGTFDRDYGTTAEGLVNLLEWSRALMEGGDWGPARQQLEILIGRAPDSDAAQDARLWLAKVLIHETKTDKAWNALDVLANDRNVRADRRAEAWYILAELNDAQTNREAALIAVAKGIELAPTAALRKRGEISRARLLMKSKRLEEGRVILKDLIAAEPQVPLSSRLQLELAQAYYTAGQYGKAAEEYQYYLETFTNREGQAEAASGKGMALFKEGRYGDAAAAFEKAWALLSDPASKAQALFKIGDAWFAKGQYVSAGDVYQRLISEHASSELVPNAMYQCGESRLRAEALPEGQKQFQSLIATYPQSPWAERAAFRLAENLEERGKLEEALTAYGDMLLTYTNGAYFGSALHRRALLLYRQFRFDDALRGFKRVVDDYGTNTIAEQANFMRGWCLYMLGRDNDALDLCRSFVNQYANSEWSPGVLFWIGEYQYNHEIYEDAERQFMRLVENYPGHSLADQALFWAGRAAAKQKQYLRSIEHFGRLVKMYPQSAYLADARFFQGDAMSELGDLSSSILIFEEIITRYPTNSLICSAWIRKGDCQFTLGAEDSRRYSEALTSYRAALNSEFATPDLSLQTEYKIGRCNEKMGRLDDALEQYYTRGVCRFFEEREKRRAFEPAAAVWFTRAAFAAADILEGQGNWRRAARILQRVVDANVPAAVDAQERIDRIRADHWGLFY